MINTIQLPAQEVFTVQREIAGIQLMLTPINGQLYPSGQQAMQLLEIDHARAFRHHLDAVAAEESSRGGTAFPPCYLTVHELPVYTPPATATSGGGGTQLLKFYHPRLVFAIGMRTRNGPHKSAIMEWLIHLGDEVVQHGFYVDQTAYQHDPAVVAKLMARISELEMYNADLMVQRDKAEASAAGARARAASYERHYL